MSIEPCQNIKKVKLNKVSKIVGCIAEFKNRAILKFCIGNGSKSYQNDEMNNSNDHIEIGMCKCLFT